MAKATQAATTKAAKASKLIHCVVDDDDDRHYAALAAALGTIPFGRSPRYPRSQCVKQPPPPYEMRRVSITVPVHSAPLCLPGLLTQLPPLPCTRWAQMMMLVQLALRPPTLRAVRQSSA